MSRGENSKRNLRLRASAWVPPGLALVWLATLATLIHNVGIMLADWAATVCLAVLVMLVVQRGRAPARSDPQGTLPDQSVKSGTVATALDSSVAQRASPASVEDADKTEEPLNGATGLGTAGDAVGAPAVQPDPTPVRVAEIISELRVLTADEVASVLRVDINLIVRSIENGELPGNKIEDYWRVDQAALKRWLQGTYRDLTPDDLNH